MTYKNGSDQGFLNLTAAKTSNHGLRKSSSHPSTLSYKVVGVPIPLAYQAIYRGRSGSRSSVHHARRERQRLESLEVSARLSEGDELLEERRGGGVVDEAEPEARVHDDVGVEVEVGGAVGGICGARKVFTSWSTTPTLKWVQAL